MIFLKKNTDHNKVIGILYVATGKYTFFWKDFFESAEKNLFEGQTKKYFVFTDQPEFFSGYGDSVIALKIPHLQWPYPTLFRYKYFLQYAEVLSSCDYLFFFNSNMIILRKVGNDILPSGNQKLVVLKHPGYFRSGKRRFPYERNPNSTAYIPHGKGRYYFAGGLHGGYTVDFLEMAKVIQSNVEADEHKDLIAVWHDESHLNKYMLEFDEKLILGPRYGYPEGWCLLVGVPKIRIIDKSKKGGHNYFRS